MKLIATAGVALLTLLVTGLPASPEPPKAEDGGKLVAALKGGDGPARREALSALRAALDTSAARMKGSRDVEEVDRALRRLDTSRDEVVSALGACVKDGDAAVRVDALETLTEIDKWGHVLEKAANEALDDREAAVRRVAARALRDIWARPTSALAPIFKALSHDDPSVKDEARSGLYHRYRGARSPFDPLDARAEVPALARLLGDERAEVRDIAANCLWMIGPRKARAAIPALAAALKDPDEHVRLHAASALLIVEPENRAALALLADALPGLCAPAEGLPGGRRLHVLSWMLLIMNGGMPGPGSPIIGLPADVFPILGEKAAPALPILVDSLHVWITQAYMHDVSPEVTATLLKIGPAAVPALIGAMSDKDFLFRKNVANALGAFGPGAKAAVPALVDALNSPVDPTLRSLVATINALGRIGPEAAEAVPELVKMLDRHAVIQTSAIAALGEIGPAASPAVPALVTLLREPHYGHIVADALAKIGPAAREGLNGAMKDPSEAVRIAAAGALARIDPGDRDARKVLDDGLRGAPEVRIAAALALAELGPSGKAALPVLLAADREHRPKDDYRSRLHYIRAACKIDPDDEGARKARDDCLRDLHPSQRQEAFRDFRYLGMASRPAVRSIVPFLEDPDGEVRAAAASLLGEYGPAAREALPALRSALGGEMPLREVAAEAIEKIQGREVEP